MHFEENQLSPRSIGISPLPTVHPSILQHTTVRSSTTFYRRFNLTMGRSRGFGSNPCHQSPSTFNSAGAGALFRLAFARPPEVVFLKQRHGLTRRLILQKARRHPSHKDIGLRLLVGGAVSATLSLPSRCAFHLSLTVLVRYRWHRVFSLGRWSSQIPTGFLVSRGTRVPGRPPTPVAYGTLTRCGRPSQAVRLKVGGARTPAPRPRCPWTTV